MSVLILVARIVVGAIIGWFVGMFLTRVMFALENRSFDRKTAKLNRKAEKALLRPLAK